MRRLVLVLSSAFALVAAARGARGQSPAEGGGAAGAGEWRAATGLRIEQWFAPRGGGLGLDVRLTLPEMAHGRFSVETFSWERLDVMEEELDPTPGTIYQVLGLRRWFGGARAGVFAGAHLMSFARHARGFTPWFGFRVGRAGDGPALAGEVRLYGLGVVGWRGGGIDTGEVSLRLTGPRIGSTRLAGRARMRSVAEVQRDANMAAGIEMAWRGRPMFVGLGLETLERPAPEPADMMMEAAPVRATAAVVLHLEVDMELPRSLAE